MPAPHQASQRSRRSVPSRSPAINVVRPLLLGALALAGAGWFRDSAPLLAGAAGLLLLAAMVGSVVHQGHRRRVEQASGIRCG